MELLLNGKHFDEWTEDDLLVLIDNADYSENDYIDYKATFAFYEAKTTEDKQRKVAEFKHDICSFANASGGFLFFGIIEEKGVPKEIRGLEISNYDADRSEQDLRNKMTGIQPAIPTVIIKHISLSNGRFVIVVRVHEGSYVPYVFKENEASYRFIIRRGNGKKEMSYIEIRNAFTSAINLSGSIQRFREARHLFFHERFSEVTEPMPRYTLMHIVPESIVDTSSHRKLFTMMQDEKYSFASDFSRFCNVSWHPNVDGLEYIERQFPNGLAVNFFNNGSAELYTDLNCDIFSGERSDVSGHAIFLGSVWYNMRDFLNNYISAKRRFTYSKRIFLAFSVIGCKGCISDITRYGSVSRVDRNVVSNVPIQLEDMSNEEIVADAIERLADDFLLSLGVRDLTKKNIQ